MGFKTNHRLMQVKSIAECSPTEHSAILSIFIKLSFVIKIFVLSILVAVLHRFYCIYTFFILSRKETHTMLLKNYKFWMLNLGPGCCFEAVLYESLVVCLTQTSRNLCLRQPLQQGLSQADIARYLRKGRDQWFVSSMVYNIAFLGRYWG